MLGACDGNAAQPRAMPPLLMALPLGGLLPVEGCLVDACCPEGGPVEGGDVEGSQSGAVLGTLPRLPDSVLPDVVSGACRWAVESVGASKGTRERK